MAPVVKTVSMVSDKGFTLIELMITAAIIGILAAIAIPNFSPYALRAYKSSADIKVIELRQQVEEYFGWHGSFPADNERLGTASPQGLGSQFIDTIEIEDGAIHVTFGARVAKELQGQIISYRPMLSLTEPPRITSWCRGAGDCQNRSNCDGENQTGQYGQKVHGINRTSPKQQ